MKKNYIITALASLLLLTSCSMNANTIKTNTTYETTSEDISTIVPTTSEATSTIASTTEVSTTIDAPTTSEATSTIASTTEVSTTIDAPTTSEATSTIASTTEVSTTIDASTTSEVTTTSLVTETTSTTIQTDSSILIDVQGENKYAVTNPGMGFYSTRYIDLKRANTTIDTSNLYSNGFYHVRIDLSDFSSKTNNDKDYDITDDALKKLNEYFSYAKEKKCYLIIRFAYDDFKGKSDLEPDISMIKNHIKSLSSIINNYTDLFLAIECGLIGPWGEMHTSTLSNQATYNVLLEEWLKDVNKLPILSRKPKYVYGYLGLDYSQLDSYISDPSNRLGVFNDGYYGTEYDTGTYENMEEREKETLFISKLNTPFGGELIGEPTNFFTYDQIINEMSLVNLTYLNSEWKDSIINSWKSIEYGLTTFYDFMLNNMGFKLYFNEYNAYTLNNVLYFNFDLKNFGFSSITRDLNLKIIFKDNDGNTLKEDDKAITNSCLSFDSSIDCNLNNYKLYLSITDNLGRSYELMNTKYEDELNYIARVSLEEN